MNKLLLRLATVILSLGMLGAAACSGCSETPETTSPAMQQQSMKCGAYTHREGNQCVGNTSSTRSTGSSPTTLNTSGNN